MRTKRTFEVIIRQVTEFGYTDYPTISAKEERQVASTELNEKFCEIYAGSLISTVLKFLEDNGVDALKSLCHAIESLGEVGDDEGHATVFMGPLYDPACDVVRGEKSA